MFNNMVIFTVFCWFVDLGGYSTLQCLVQLLPLGLVVFFRDVLNTFVRFLLSLFIIWGYCECNICTWSFHPTTFLTIFIRYESSVWILVSFKTIIICKKGNLTPLLSICIPFILLVKFSSTFSFLFSFQDRVSLYRPGWLKNIEVYLSLLPKRWD